MLVRSILNTTILVIICGFASSSLAAKKSKDKYSYNYAALNNRCQVYDPYEAFNRKMFVVNGVLDTFILRPFAKGYGRFTNQYTKHRIGSFRCGSTEVEVITDFEVSEIVMVYIISMCHGHLRPNKMISLDQCV